MPALLSVLYLFGGIVYLVMGGDLLVRGAMSLARKARISKVVVGLTVVAFGTSAPELVVSLRAALAGFPELAITNVTGSNIANVLLVIGLPSMVHVMACDQEGIARDTLFMLFVSFLFFGLTALGPLGRGDGVILLAGLAFFLGYVVRASSLKRVWASDSEEMERVLGLPSAPGMIVVFLILGSIGLPLGAELLIRGAVGVAEVAGVPNAVVGLTLVALGTSLPELATTLVAAFKKEADLAVGNVVGSNILNLLAIMGATAVVSPVVIDIPVGLLERDLPVMLGAALILTSVTVRRGSVGRGLGAALLSGYILYCVLLFRS